MPSSICTILTTSFEYDFETFYRLTNKIAIAACRLSLYSLENNGPNRILKTPSYPNFRVPDVRACLL